MTEHVNCSIKCAMDNITKSVEKKRGEITNTHKGYGGDKSICKKCGKEFRMKRLLREHKQWDHAI